MGEGPDISDRVPTDDTTKELDMDERAAQAPGARIALVTGGAGGIGSGCGRALARAGMTVVLTDLDADRAAAAARDVADVVDGATVVGLAHDVTEPSSSASVVAEVVERFGTLDVLVNNAGVGPRPGPVQDLEPSEFDRVMGVNVRGVFLVTRAVVPTMLTAGSGRIVNISSVMGQSADANVVAYVTSKHAVIGMTRALAMELAPSGITVNAVCPGVVETDLHAAVVEAFSAGSGTPVEESWESFRARIPLGRFQTADDMGAAVAFLAGEGAANITGTQLGVDGGWVMH